MDFTCKRASWKVIENGIDHAVVQNKLGRSKFQPAACKKYLPMVTQLLTSQIVTHPYHRVLRKLRPSKTKT